MSLRVSGKNLDLGEVLRSQAEERLAAAVEKYFDGGFSGHVTVERDGPDFKTECSVHLDSGSTMNVSATAGDAYASLNHAIDRISKQLRRNKRKRDDHSAHVDGGLRGAADDVSDFDEEGIDPGTSSALIAEPLTQVAVMSMAHAVAALERNGGASMLFRNVGTRRFNYIYRRADGHIGWIDLSENATASRDQPTAAQSDTRMSAPVS
ncbi:MAG: ribosome-associated translation inhibitor RaiA [Beijerinckiaceae bacterium]|nr:ribosome-associated translation inhibitor RaiA [Beijerinckiaceae bacterium]